MSRNWPASSDETMRLLNAAVDTVVPPDSFAGGAEAGAAAFVLQMLHGELRDRSAPFFQGLAALDADARQLYGAGFAALTHDQRADVLQRIESGECATDWAVSPREFTATLVELTTEGYYGSPAEGGNADAASWRMIGYEPRMPASPVGPRYNASRSTSHEPADELYDAVVVGSGAAGGIVACVLAEAGKHVLLLERGQDLDYQHVGHGHLRNHRLSKYGHNTGPDLLGNPRVAVDSTGRKHVVRPHEELYQNNAMTVGGGTRVYGAQAWRFMPQDFMMASLYGIPAGSSLADWPLQYDDLAPYYERAEWEIGVAGDGAAAGRVAPRTRGYPLPHVAANPQSGILAAGARKLGISTMPVPMLINTHAYGGRAACMQCGACVGFACPTDAKNGTHNTAIPRALASGRCTMITEATASEIMLDQHGRPYGVRYCKDGEERVARGRVVVVSCGAIESARLLLNSRSDLHPAGLGNDTDQVGRHLQGHAYPGAWAVMSEPCYDGRGPGVSIATTDFNHGNPGIIGGSMLANEFIPLPIVYQKRGWPPDRRRWGADAKQYMRDSYRRAICITGPVQEIPDPDGRVTVDSAVRDHLGIPVARLSGTTHRETVRVGEYMRARAEEWLRASGAVSLWGYAPPLRLFGGQHQAGTCRMGTDANTSVTDPWGRVHGHENLFVVDGSLHVTNGGFNPVLTIMALAYRCAEHIVTTL